MLSWIFSEIKNIFSDKTREHVDYNVPHMDSFCCQHGTRDPLTKEIEEYPIT